MKRSNTPSNILSPVSEEGAENTHKTDNKTEGKETNEVGKDDSLASIGLCSRTKHFISCFLLDSDQLFHI